MMRMAGKVVLEGGDIFNIPTGIFCGFGTIGTDCGMIMVGLGGDDSGVRVIRAPEMIEDARDHGLVLYHVVAIGAPAGATWSP